MRNYPLVPLRAATFVVGPLGKTVLMPMPVASFVVGSSSCGAPSLLTVDAPDVISKHGNLLTYNFAVPACALAHLLIVSVLSGGIDSSHHSRGQMLSVPLLPMLPMLMRS